MMRLVSVPAWPALLAALLSACNDVGACPASSQIEPGGSCSGDQLECPYTLETPSAACDGTVIEGGLQTSCTCQKGTWSCPSPVSCDAAGAGDAGQQDGTTSGDAGSADAQSTDSADSMNGAETSPDAASDAPTDAAGD